MNLVVIPSNVWSGCEATGATRIATEFNHVYSGIIIPLSFVPIRQRSPLFSLEAKVRSTLLSTISHSDP